MRSPVILIAILLVALLLISGCTGTGPNYVRLDPYKYPTYAEPYENQPGVTYYDHLWKVAYIGQSAP